MALANDQARESFETDPARNAGANTCPEKTTLKVCRTRAANTGVRRACRNPSLNRRLVLMKMFRATASSSLSKEIKHDRSQPDLAGISGDCFSIRRPCRDPAEWLRHQGWACPPSCSLAYF